MTKTKVGWRLLARLGPQVSLAIIVACATFSNDASAQINQAVSPAAASVLGSQVKILGPKDSIEVKVYQEADLDTKAIIDPSGGVTLPLIGQVHLGQKTPDEAAEIIRSLYAKDYLVNPRVSLIVLEEAKIRFTVMGQVQRPGSYEFTSTDPVNLLQAIAMAGGYTRLGSASKVSLQRVNDGRSKVLTLDADRMAQDKQANPIQIESEDIIIVGEKIF